MTGETDKKPLRLIENPNEFAVLSEDGESVLSRTYIEPHSNNWAAFSSESFRHEIGTFNIKRDALDAAYNYLKEQYKNREIIDMTSRAQEGSLVNITAEGDQGPFGPHPCLKKGPELPNPYKKY